MKDIIDMIKADPNIDEAFKTGITKEQIDKLINDPTVIEKTAQRMIDLDEFEVNR